MFSKHYQIRGLGELATVGVAPVIINTIYNAIGIRFKTLPVTPEKVKLFFK